MKIVVPAEAQNPLHQPPDRVKIRFNFPPPRPIFILPLFIRFRNQTELVQNQVGLVQNHLYFGAKPLNPVG